jgi:hypothetical protein
VALLLGATVIAMGALTAGIGAVVEHNAAAASAERVAADLDGTLEPVEVTGEHHGQVSFADGRLRWAPRDLRVLDATGVRRRVRVGALVYEGADHRVTYLSGAVVRGTPGNAWLRAPPPLTVSPDVLVVGAATVNETDTVTGSGGVTVPLTTHVSHDRTGLGAGEYRIAIETRTPRPWTEYFEDEGATVIRKDLDGDGVPSVVARFPGVRTGYLVVHDLGLEVGA